MYRFSWLQLKQYYANEAKIDVLALFGSFDSYILS
jgi:hypothetical protein